MHSLRELESRANHYISALQRSAREVEAATREIHRSNSSMRSSPPDCPIHAESAHDLAQ